MLAFEGLARGLLKGRRLVDGKLQEENSKGVDLGGETVLRAHRVAEQTRSHCSELNF